MGCGGNVAGTYVPVVATGQKLEYVTTSTPNYWRFTNSDGSVITFTPSGIPRASVWTMPDGTRLDFNYSGAMALQSVFSNHGWAILFESSSKYCVVNTAQTYVTSASTCPANAQTATYTSVPGVYNVNAKLLTSATVGGSTRTYQYASDDHVNCIKDPGQSTCRILNTYGHCPEDLDVAPSGIQPSARLHDPVTSQQDGSGRTYGYAYVTDYCPMFKRDIDQGYPDYSYWTGQTTTVTESGVSGSTVATSGAGVLGTLKDALNRQWQFSYDNNVYAPDGLVQIVAAGELIGVTYPEGNQLSYGIDARANRISSTGIAKSGSGLANIATASAFPTNCSNVITCNKPSSVTDARGNTIDYTYDPTHGGILTESAPADSNGIRPVKRYSYVQRTAWLKNSSGGYTVSAYPVWLVNDMRTCRTSATIGNACSAGSADEVVTTYDYGPNSGPNNLLVRGIIVTADGVSRRTCYAYDINGRKISETRPNANLTTCP
jgi:YD repeat-containing protein